MKKIFKLTTISFLGPFVATFFIVLFTVLIQFLWRYIDDLVGKGLEWYIITELLFYASASFVPLSLPLAVLLSSIMCFGKMAETYELVALKSAGVSLLRVMVPLITVIGLMTVGAFFFSNNIIPRANLKFHSLLWDIQQQRPALDIKEGVFYGGLDNYSIRITRKDKKGQKIEGILIYDHTRGRGDDIVMTASHGEMETTPDKHWLILKLYDGTRYEEMDPNLKGPPSYPANRLNFKSYELKFDLSAFNLARTREELFKENSEMLNIGQLTYYSDSLAKLKERKSADVMDFARPYLSFLRDSIYYRQQMAHKEVMPPASADTFNRLFARLRPMEKRQSIMRAINNARTLQEVMHTQTEELSDFDKVSIKYRMEWHRKFSLSLACLTFFFIGAPLGAIIRKGGIGMPTIASIVLFIVFYIISLIGEKSAKEGAIDVFTGMWMPTMILMPIGFYLTWRANIDAIQFSTDRLKRVIRRVNRFFQASNEEDENTAAD